MSQLKKRSLIPNPSRLIWHTAGGGFGNRKSNFSPVSNHHRFINPLSYGIKISRKIVFLSKCHAVFARYSEGMYSAGPLTCEKAIPMGFLGFAPIFPDICYHLTHYKPAAADIPVASDNPAHYADAIRYNARTPLQGSLLPLTRLVWA